MSAAPLPLPPPTEDERRRAAIADSTTMGERGVMFVDFSSPGGRRRGECRETWANLPGFVRVGRRYRHELLPGWEYRRAEVKAEMIPDLEALAERGVRPTEATSAGVGR
jgi:hypothetical protein